MRTLSSLLLPFLSIVPVAACTGSEAVEDSRDGTFAGKADDFGISESSPEARGVLRVANELSRTALSDDVGLAKLAVDGIIAFRVGDDDELGTEDDPVIATLAELDRIPYVGAAAFDKLLAYAQGNGYIQSADVILSYRYGSYARRSTLTVFADGTGVHEERRSPTEVTQVPFDPIGTEGVGILRWMISKAKEGPLTTSAGAPATAGGAVGELIGYTEDGTEVPIQIIGPDIDGDSYFDVTINTSIGATELRPVVLELVENDMPQ